MSKPELDLMKSSSGLSMKEHRDGFSDINTRNEFEKNSKEILFFAKNHSQNIAPVNNLTSDWQSGQILSAMFNEYVVDWMRLEFFISS
jgi:hypothetical protein